MAGRWENVAYRPKDGGEGSSKRNRRKDTRDYVKDDFLEIQRRGQRAFETKNTDSYDLANAYYRGDKYTPKEYVTKEENRILGMESLTQTEFDEKYPWGEEFYRDNLRYKEEKEISTERTIAIANNQTKEHWTREEYYNFYILSHGEEDQQYPHQNILPDRAREAFTELKKIHDMDIKIDSTRMPIDGTVGDTIHLLLNGEKASLVFKSAPNPDFNCYGYLFTNGTGGWLTQKDVKQILQDYNYKTTASKSLGQENIRFEKTRKTRKAKKIKDGDACLYYRDGILVHGGKVVIKKDGSTVIKGKMGPQGILEHPVDLPFKIKWDKWEILHTDERGGTLPNLKK